jgi:hypothetical protein
MEGSRAIVAWSISTLAITNIAGTTGNPQTRYPLHGCTSRRRKTNTDATAAPANSTTANPVYVTIASNVPVSTSAQLHTLWSTMDVTGNPSRARTAANARGMAPSLAICR